MYLRLLAAVDNGVRKSSLFNLKFAPKLSANQRDAFFKSEWCLSSFQNHFHLLRRQRHKRRKIQKQVILHDFS